MRTKLSKLWDLILYRLARPERNHGGPDYELYWAAQVAEGPLPDGWVVTKLDDCGRFPETRSESVCQPRSGCVCGSQPVGCAASQGCGEGPC